LITPHSMSRRSPRSALISAYIPFGSYIDRYPSLAERENNRCHARHHHSSRILRWCRRVLSELHTKEMNRGRHN
jgi:hypothetical protein